MLAKVGQHRAVFSQLEILVRKNDETCNQKRNDQGYNQHRRKDPQTELGVHSCEGYHPESGQQIGKKDRASAPRRLLQQGGGERTNGEKSSEARAIWGVTLD